MNANAKIFFSVAGVLMIAGLADVATPIVNGEARALGAIAFILGYIWMLLGDQKTDGQKCAACQTSSPAGERNCAKAHQFHSEPAAAGH